MEFIPWRNASLVLAMVPCVCIAAFSQTSPQDSDRLTFRIKTQLVLVDVIAEYDQTQVHTRALLTDLKREDFRVFDNRKEIPIHSFDVGATGGTRPIALWLIVQSPLGFEKGWASDFLRGNTQFLKPALAHLDANDAVGVAHWCDDGVAAIDLPPGHDPDAALGAIDHLLNQKVFYKDNRSGELAMQKMIRLMVSNVHHATPDRLPILLFLYGDHCATYVAEADRIIEKVLETSGIVFGMSDGSWLIEPHSLFIGDQIRYLAHYYSRETGGEFYTTADPKLFSAALDYILSQVYLRYTIGFKPLASDGKIHTLKVELTTDAQSRFRGVQLRFRRKYLPVKTHPSDP
ncbi:MAG TPA: hypothetical protein VI386_08440 [Candidatus Sulfotelmatobacter sp.]